MSCNVCFRSILFEIKRVGIYAPAVGRTYKAIQSTFSLYLTVYDFQIVIQGVVSLFLVMYGVMYIAGDFKEIKASADLENKTWETFRNIPSFYTFNHRGKALSYQYMSYDSKSSFNKAE